MSSEITKINYTNLENQSNLENQNTFNKRTLTGEDLSREIEKTILELKRRVQKVKEDLKRLRDGLVNEDRDKEL